MDGVAKEAYKRNRGIDPLELYDPIELESWFMVNTIKGVHEWTTEMSEDFWMRGCIVERFLYVYALYMIAGEARQIKKEWCIRAVKDAVGWLERAM